MSRTVKKGSRASRRGGTKAAIRKRCQGATRTAVDRARQSVMGRPRRRIRAEREEWFGEIAEIVMEEIEEVTPVSSESGRPALDVGQLVWVTGMDWLDPSAKWPAKVVKDGETRVMVALTAPRGKWKRGHKLDVSRAEVNPR